MSQENGNTQTPPAVPPSAGPTVEELQAKLAEYEKAKEGLIRDVQQERAKRQELEQRIAPPAPSPGTEPDVNNDELGRVLKPYLDPVKKEASQIVTEYYRDKALDHLSAKTGKSRDQIMADMSFQDRLVATARKWNLRGNDYEVATRAYELMELEEMKAKEVERQRNVNAGSQSNLSIGTPPAPSAVKKEYSAEEFDTMPLHEFDRLSKAGDFKKTPAGSFVYTSRT
jgi:hypothetical protein